MNYYQRIKDIREDKDLNQKDIAKILETSTGKISEYESGKVMMRIDKYIKLAKYYNVSLDYLTGITDTYKPLDETKITKTKILNEQEKAIIKAYRSNKTIRTIFNKIKEIEDQL